MIKAKLYSSTDNWQYDCALGDLGYFLVKNSIKIV